MVDDSATVRQAMVRMLEKCPDMELLGTAPNPVLAGPMLAKTPPDVLLLDIEMPGMDGLTFLRQLMANTPIPTVICSSLTEKGSHTAFEAMTAGAVAVVGKPEMGIRQFLEDSSTDLLQTLRMAAQARIRRHAAAPNPQGSHASPLASPSALQGKHAPAPAPLLKPGTHALGGIQASMEAQTNALQAIQARLTLNRPILIGGSAGGTQAIEAILTQLPAHAPGIAITQHMPEKFTAMYAERLNSLCAVKVREACDGDRMERGLVLLAPGGRHMQIGKAFGQYFVKVSDGPLVNRHKPSVDVLFKSGANVAGKNALGILLTGMGDDGARGLLAMHEAGALTIAQDEATCTVFGMPMEAIRLGAARKVLGLHQMAAAIMDFDQKKGVAQGVISR